MSPKKLLHNKLQPGPDRRFDELGELQQAILEELWKRGEATVQQVREGLQRPTTPAYTTVLSLLQKLEKNRWVTHRIDGRAYIYRPLVTRSVAQNRSLRAFVDQLFGGDPLQLFAHLLDDPRMSTEEIAEIRKLIRQKRKRDGS